MNREHVSNRQQLGRLGEQLAADYLQRQGYLVLERNWRCPIGELDLVVRKGDVVAAIEVKTRQSLTFGSPTEAITALKARRLRRLLALWLAEHPQQAEVVRVDLVAIYRPVTGHPELSHLKAVA